MPLVAAKCTQCGANIEVDKSKEAGICKYCGTAFITEKVINNYRIDTDNVFVNGENITISNFNIEAALEASNKLIKRELYDDAKELLDEIIKKFPYDYRGWWEMALYEYRYHGKWFNENENYKKAIALADDDSLLKQYRNKEYERLWEEGKKIVEFCENVDISMLDKIYMPDSYLYYNNGLCCSYLGLEVVDNQLCYIKYKKMDDRLDYWRTNFGKTIIKAEIHSYYDRARVMGTFYDMNGERMDKKYDDLYITDIFDDFYITDIIDGQVVLGDEKDKMVRGNQLIDIVNSKQKKGGCYIATCVYGSYDCPQVWTLRRFRDYTLEKTWYGRLFIKCYYTISPKLVKWFGETKWFRRFCKTKLDKIVTNLNKQGIDDTFYKGK